MKTASKTFRFEQKLVDKLQELATEENRNLNNLVETILIKYLKQLEK